MKKQKKLDRIILEAEEYQYQNSLAHDSIAEMSYGFETEDKETIFIKYNEDMDMHYKHQFNEIIDHIADKFNLDFKQKGSKYYLTAKI